MLKFFHNGRYYFHTLLASIYIDFFKSSIFRYSQIKSYLLFYIVEYRLL